MKLDKTLSSFGCSPAELDRRILKSLKKARKQLKDESNWTHGEAARNEFGNPCDPDSGDAVCWCIAGAVMRNSPDGLVARMACETVANAAIPFGCHYGALDDFNDSQSFKKVKKALKYAVRLQKDWIKDNK